MLVCVRKVVTDTVNFNKGQINLKKKTKDKSNGTEYRPIVWRLVVHIDVYEAYCNVERT